MLKRISRILCRPFILMLVLIYRMKIFDKEKLIKQGPAILVSNHRSYIDIIFIMSMYKGNEIIFVGKSSIRNNPIGRFVGWAYNVILVDRDGSDSIPLRNMIKVVKENKILGIFPEGTRQGLHKGKFRSGATYIALRTKVDIIPIAINGTLKPFRKGNYIKVGDKINLSSMIKKGKTNKDREEIKRLNEIMKSKILELVEDGFYDNIK